MGASVRLQRNRSRRRWRHAYILFAYGEGWRNWVSRLWVCPGKSKTCVTDELTRNSARSLGGQATGGSHPFLGKSWILSLSLLN